MFPKHAVLFYFIYFHCLLTLQTTWCDCSAHNDWHLEDQSSIQLLLYTHLLRYLLVVHKNTDKKSKTLILFFFIRDYMYRKIIELN